MPVPKRVANSHRQYRDNQILLSSPAELVVILFDGALRFVRQATTAFEQQKCNEAYLHLDRTRQIITELSVSLDFSQGELPKNLYSLYEYINYLLLRANIDRNADSLKNVEELLFALRESWAEAGRLSEKNRNRKKKQGYRS